MAKRKKITDEERATAEERRNAGPLYAGAPGVAPAADDVQEIDSSQLPQEILELAQEYAAEDYEITIHRRDVKTGKTEKIPETYNAAEFKPDQIALDWGGGKYYYTIRDPNKIIVKKFSCTYAERRTPAGSSQDSVLLAVKEITQALAGKQSANDDKMFQLMQTMIQAQASKPATDDLMRLKQLADLLGMNKPQEDPIKRMTEAILLGKELGAADAGGNTDLDSILKVVKALSPGMTERLLGALAPKPGQAPQPPLPGPQGGAQNPFMPAPVDVPAPPAVRPPLGTGNAEVIDEKEEDPAAEMSVEDFVLAQVQENYKAFSGFAKSGAPASFVATFLTSKIEREDMEEFAGYLTENGAKAIYARFPELAAYSAWIDTLVAELIKEGKTGTPAPQGQ